MSIVRFRGGLLGEQAQEKKVYSSGKEMKHKQCTRDPIIANGYIGRKYFSGGTPKIPKIIPHQEDDIYADILSPKVYIRLCKDLEVKCLIYPENLP
ncbi:hypothetical protein NPIL_76771 [Nephila pilipes]|uniref:Uncharacterized protein n=1 Tax=Nephila pilipes TaxID=299642 RepID=A0A8X6M5W1_NEPPI|nr:hypothetical protein NPIL_76771 [Nephila pilipes]